MRRSGSSRGSEGKNGSANESPLVRLGEGLKNANSPIFAISLTLAGALLVLVGYLANSRPEAARSLEEFRSSATEEAYGGMGAGLVFCPVMGVTMLVFGIGLLFLHLVSLAAWATRRIAAPPADPILTFLDSVGTALFASESYDKGKAEMINLISKRMTISRLEVRARIDRLEQQGRLRYLPNGQWVIHHIGRPAYPYGAGPVGGNGERAAGDTPIDWPSGE